MDRATIYAEVDAERQAQDDKWGGEGHDDSHSSHDWLAFLTKHVGRAVKYPWDPRAFRAQMIRVAALAVAAVEWHDRNRAMWTKDKPR